MRDDVLKEEVLEAVSAGSRHRLGEGAFVETDGHAKLLGARPERIVDWIRPRTAAVWVGPYVDDLETEIGHGPPRLRYRRVDVEQRHLCGAVETAGRRTAKVGDPVVVGAGHRDGHFLPRIGGKHERAQCREGDRGVDPVLVHGLHSRLRLEATRMAVDIAVLVHRARTDLAAREPRSWQTDAVVGGHVDAAGKLNGIDAVLGPNETGPQLEEGRV